MPRAQIGERRTLHCCRVTAVLAGLLLLSVPVLAGDLPAGVDPVWWQEAQRNIAEEQARNLENTPDWFTDAPFGNIGYGQSVATAGDVNGDGYSDIIFGAPVATGDELREGRAYVFLGSADGLDSDPDWWTDGGQADSHYGISVACAGDVNGDGYDDVIIGAFTYDDPEVESGKAFVYHGSADGLSSVPDWTASVAQAGANFGNSVACAGDVNGDGYSDVIVGAYDYEDGHAHEGAAFVYHGSASGLSTGYAWSEQGNREGAKFGCSVAGAGDVNGDGFDDVVLGADTYANGEVAEGAVFVYHGGVSGLGGSPAWDAESNIQHAKLGYSVAPAGDVNGDGYADVLAGAPWCDGAITLEGRVFLFEGSAGGLLPAPAWQQLGGQNNCRYGFSVATAGDINGDGYADVVVSAKDYTDNQDDEGRIYLYLGHWSGLRTTPEWQNDGDQVDAFIGYQVATAGDVNGDGFTELMVGSPGYDSGRVEVFHGAAAPPQTSAGWVTESGQDDAHYGYSIAQVGDVNGDGYSDVLVGAPDYDNGHQNEGAVFLFLGSHLGLGIPVWYAEGNQAGARLGAAVAGGGDVNGDGYPDAVVGAPGYNFGRTDEGAAFIWLSDPGSPPMGHPGNADWHAYGLQEDAELGWSVACNGDVNGDGYADVVVGAPYYTDGQANEGAAFAYFGSASGPSLTHDWFHGADQANALYGASLAYAGDFNGDGFSDIIVGASQYDAPQSQEGGAFIYIGSETGPQTGAPWWWAQSNEVGARLGFSVASAGDIDGDGFSDVLVGAPLADNAFTDGGKAFAWYGASTAPPVGTPTNADWTTVRGETSAWWGWAVASAGDVNSDGYSDVMIGSPMAGVIDDGLVAIWFGSSTGVKPGAPWVVEGNQSGADYGFVVASVGDVNGDGFSDVGVGAGYYDAGQNNEGRVFLYYGNDSRGLARAPRQHQSDFSAPIATLGLSDSETEFGIRALGRTAAGRGQVRMEYEVKLPAWPFDGTNVQTTGWYDTGVPSGLPGSRVQIDVPVTGLNEGAQYRWRVRFVSDDPFFPGTPWFTLPENGAGEMDLRMGGELVAVHEGAPAPPHALLGTVAPNPFNPRTLITYALPRETHVRVTIHDVQGRLVRTLVDAVGEAASHVVVWDGAGDGDRPLGSGVYYVRLEADGRVETRSLVLAK